MTYITDLLSLFTTVYKVVLEFPIVGISLLAGAFGYRYIVLKNPALAASLLAKLQTVVGEVEQAAAAKVAQSANTATGVGSSTPTQP